MATKAYGIAFSYAGLSSSLILVVIRIISNTGTDDSDLQNFQEIIVLSSFLSFMSLVILLFFFKEESLVGIYEDHYRKLDTIDH